MRQLLRFLIDKKHWLLALLLEVGALLLLFNSGFCRRGVGLYVNNIFVGTLSDYMTRVRSYMALREQNEQLLEDIASLQGDYINLLQRYSDLVVSQESPSSMLEGDSIGHIDYVTGRIINVNTYQDNLYYLIDRGKMDGVSPKMGVVSSRGVVGAVMNVSDHYAMVIPLINPKMRLSCAIKGKGYAGTLIPLKGIEKQVILTGLPSYAEVAKGDTVITSGYSEIFPRGVAVGILEEKVDTQGKQSQGQHTNYRVSLLTDFDRLQGVYVLKYIPDSESNQLVEEALHAIE